MHFSSYITTVFSIWEMDSLQQSDGPCHLGNFDPIQIQGSNQPSMDLSKITTPMVSTISISPPATPHGSEACVID